MCGIQFTNNPDYDFKVFEKALGLMRHRGPDSLPGTYYCENVKLGHTRLKIIDLDNRSNQPFWSADNRYVIIFNGEIYNYSELAQKYKLKLRTTSDTEVLVELFRKIGPEMLKELNGMFALLIYDQVTKNIFAARDRLGVKPLYYSIINGFYIFASEIVSILCLTGDSEIDEIGLRQYRKLRTFFNERTIYKNIKMFPAGHYLTENRIRPYWELPLFPKSPPSSDELFELLNSSVNYRCISDVPIGAYLSGGLDSTIISALAKRELGGLFTWTIGFKDDNEFIYSDLAADFIKTNHNKICIDENEFVEIAKDLINIRKEPLSVPNEVLLYKMTREAKKQNTVILSGEGADELFYGYDRIFRWAESDNWDLKKFSELYSYGTNDDLEIVQDAISPFLKYEKAIDIVSSFFQIAHLHGLLRRLDNSTMQCSVEARVPFVDYRIVERLAGVHYSYKMEDGIIKNPLKKTFQLLIPKEVIERKKVGFPVPIDKLPIGFKKLNSMDRWLNFNLNQLGIVEGFNEISNNLSSLRLK